MKVNDKGRDVFLCTLKSRRLGVGNLKWYATRLECNFFSGCICNHREGFPIFRFCLPKKRCDYNGSNIGGRCNAAQSPTLLVSPHLLATKRVPVRQASFFWQDHPNGKSFPASKSSRISNAATFRFGKTIIYCVGLRL